MAKPLIDQISTRGSGKRKGQLSKNTLEFNQAYNELVDQLSVDPLVVMFKLCKSRDKSIRFQASKELLNYRYSKQASVKVETNLPAQISFSWENETDALLSVEPELQDLEKVIN